MQQETVSKSASRLGRFAQATTSDSNKKKKKPEEVDMVKRVQDFAKEEQARKEEEKKKKKNTPVSTEPSKGFLQRMYEKYVSPKGK